MDFTWLIAPFLGLVRSFGGWLDNALSDGKIDQYEWAKLIGTVIRVVIMTTMIHFGTEAYGIDVNVVGEAVTAYLADFVLSAIKKVKP